MELLHQLWDVYDVTSVELLHQLWNVYDVTSVELLHPLWEVYASGAFVLEPLACIAELHFNFYFLWSLTTQIKMVITKLQ